MTARESCVVQEWLLGPEERAAPPPPASGRRGTSAATGRLA
ncbi:hypothetical protein [Streptomyces sp. NPDC055681]